MMTVRSTPGRALGDVMGALRVVFVVALGLPLAGCFSVTGPKPLPEWAMSHNAQVEQPQRQRTARRAPSHRYQVTGELTARQAAARSGVTGSVPARASNDDIKSFGPEWQAREDARDDRLRRSMSICRGC